VLNTSRDRVGSRVRDRVNRNNTFGSDAGAVYDERRAALLITLRGDGVLDRNWEMPFGSMPGSMMAEIAFMEHLTHAWDLAKATGQEATIPADVVKECADTVAPMDAMLRMPGVCGPAVTVGDDASVLDKLIAFMASAVEVGSKRPLSLKNGWRIALGFV
jgi:uncharacterized protein (TIGR03086 family)